MNPKPSQLKRLYVSEDGKDPEPEVLDEPVPQTESYGLASTHGVYKHVVPLCEINPKKDANPNAQDVTQFFVKHLAAFVRQIRSESRKAKRPVSKFALVMDNAPRHTDAVKRTIKELGVHVITGYPPYSPDLNPIENYWRMLVSRLSAQSLSTVQGVRAAIKTAHSAMRTDGGHAKVVEMCRNYAKRLQKVIDLKGGAVQG